MSENFQIKTYDSEKSGKKRFDNNPSFYSGKALQSSNREFNFVKNDTNEPKFNFSSTSKNNTTLISQDVNNTSSLSLQSNEYLYGNDFVVIEKPSKIGKTRVCFYIKNYPYISIGKDIFFPLLLILFICLIYIFIVIFFFEEGSMFLKTLLNYFFIIYIIFFLLSIFVNPGTPSFKYHQTAKQSIQENKEKKFSYSKCKKCKLIYKLKDNIGHCKECNICYFNYDRHCFWIGHCIGKYNKLFFVCFVLSLFTFLMLCLTLIIIKILKVFFIK